MNVRTWCKRKYVYFYSKILKEKASPEYIARGWAIGMFCGCLIPFGLQLVVSIPASFLLKGSKIGATLGTLLTNHFTIFIIYPVQCYVGSKLMGGDLSYAKVNEVMQDVLKHQDYATLFGLGWTLTASFFIGGAILTAVMTPLTYWGILKLVRRHRARKEKMRLERDAAVGRREKA